MQIFPEMGDHLVKTLILLAVFNGEKHLPALLDSLKAQTDSAFSVLVQDDGSDDGSPALLDALFRADSRFLPGCESGRHLGAAGNFLSLIRQADAALVFLCDQDDVWEPEKVAVLKQAMTESVGRYGAGTPILVHSDCSLIDEDGCQTGDSFFRHQGWDPKAVTLPRLLVQNNVTGCTLVMNRPLCRLVAEHGRAKDLFMHDWFIALTAASFGRVVFIPRALTAYRQHAGNEIGASRLGLLARGFRALAGSKKARRRILLTYTHTQVFCRLYGDLLPEEARRITSAYLATRAMQKIPRVMAVRRLGCIMQSPVTRLGQMLFG